MADTKYIKRNEKPEALPTDEVPVGETETPAWEQIESGRYMPRRIRGSFRGRALG